MTSLWIFPSFSFLSDLWEIVTKFREKTMKRDLITSKRDWTANDRAYASNQFFRIFWRCFPNLNQWWSPEQQLCWNKWWWLRHLQTPKLNGTDILNSISTVRQKLTKTTLHCRWKSLKFAHLNFQFDFASKYIFWAILAWKFKYLKKLVRILMRL